MNEDRSRNGSSERKGWFEKLSNALLGEPQDRNQLVDVLRDSQKRHLLDQDALAMIEGVLHVSEMQVRDIMIPRSQMIVVDRDDSLEEIVRILVESAHSRFPVIGESRDEVVGILLAKDLLFYRFNEEHQLNLRDILRPAIFVPESKRLDVLLKEFRANRNHLALVVDEYGGVAGMVTIEDVLEQIVGEIEDEHDFDEEAYILKHNDTSFTIKALTPVEDFNEYFGTHWSDEEYDTVGGLLLSSFGYVPKRGEVYTFDQYRFKVVRADNRRLHLLQLTVLPREKKATKEVQLS